MDTATLAASVVTVLAPYLAKAGEEFAKEVGKTAGGKIGALYQAIKSRFQHHPAASEALIDLEQAPGDEDAQAALRQQLKKILATDDDFARQMNEWLQAYQANANTSITASGDHSTAAGRDVRTTTAGRDISGQVFSGDIQGDIKIGS